MTQDTSLYTLGYCGTLSSVGDFSIRQLVSTSDAAFLPAMELYVESFVRDEREPVASFARMLSEQTPTGSILGTRRRLLVAEDNDRNVIGMRYLESNPEVRLGFLVYVAVDPRYRRAGIGRRLIETALALIEADMVSCGTVLDAACFEVERIDLARDDEDRMVRLERLKFFKSLGAKLVSPSYVQPALTEDREPVPLYLMAHRLNPAADPTVITRNFCTTFLGMKEGDPELAEALAGASSSVTLDTLIEPS